MALVLTVDDSATMRQLVCFTLLTAGHHVEEACNVGEALILTHGRQFDLVIVDINLPGRNGIELVRELRKRDGYWGTPILMLTTESAPQLRQIGKAAGATGWIVKPFNPSDLLSVLQRVLPTSDAGTAQRLACH
jgi:two-component system chemotaxis response regulator CheY